MARAAAAAAGARAAAAAAARVGVARAAVAAVGARAEEVASRVPVRAMEVAEEMGGAGLAKSVVQVTLGRLLLCIATKEASARAPCAP